MVKNSEPGPSYVGGQWHFASPATLQLRHWIHSSSVSKTYASKYWLISAGGCFGAGGYICRYLGTYVRRARRQRLTSF